MTYCYKCSICGEFEVERSIKEPALTACITSGCKGKIVQVFSSPLVQWKCGGDYNSTRNNGK